jgi:hypothetical protein|tara:strand:+ start:5014 stop:5460 length:447 start_codon:yes stop_codon:yes gene_type:complete
MDHLEAPDPLDWDERRLWFEEQEAEAAGEGLRHLPEQAAALLIDLQAVFCSGAWAAAIILAGAVVEAQLKAVGTAAQADGDDQRWLRALRNRLLHAGDGAAILTVQDQWTNRAAWEQQARRAVRLLFATLYAPRPALPNLADIAPVDR